MVAQVIDYASWVETLSSDKISSIYADFVNKYGDSSLSFDAVFNAKFGDSLAMLAGHISLKAFDMKGFEGRGYGFSSLRRQCAKLYVLITIDTKERPDEPA